VTSEVAQKKAIRFTKERIDGLHSTDKRQYLYDTKYPQLGLTVQPSGAKSFFVRVTIQGVTKRVGIENGRFPGMTPEIARKKAAEILALVARDENPIVRRRRKKLADITLRDALNVYLDSKRTRKGLELKDKTKTDYRNAMHESFKDYLDKPLHSVTESVLRKRHKVRSKQSKARFDNAIRVLKALFNWMNKVYLKGSYPVNPTDMMADEGLRYKPDRKSKYIYRELMPDWFDAIEQQAPRVREYFEFVLLTGCRAGEAAFLEWQDIDLRSKVFSLLDTKNRRDVELPIPEYLLPRLKRRKKAKGRVFDITVSGSKSKDHGGVKFTYARYERKAIETACDFSFTIHSLRNTFLTVGNDLAPARTLKALVNHISADVTDGYIDVGMDKMRAAQAEINREILNQAKRYKAKLLTVVK
jgi:integrase